MARFEGCTTLYLKRRLHEEIACHKIDLKLVFKWRHTTSYAIVIWRTYLLSNAGQCLRPNFALATIYNIVRYFENIGISLKQTPANLAWTT